MGLNVIVTGATGMVGEGVLHECLLDDRVSAVLIINRKPSGMQHPKLREIIHSDFFDLSPVSTKLKGFDACYFCLGVSSVGMKEPEYTRLTHTLTLHFANIVVRENRDMVFCYVSGASTDSTEKGRSMWARVKGKTENDLMKLPFSNVFAFRPGFMKPTAGLKNVLGFYKYVNWLFPFLRKIFPGSACTLREVGVAMINVTLLGSTKKVLEVRDIVRIAAMGGRQS